MSPLVYITLSAVWVLGLVSGCGDGSGASDSGSRRTGLTYTEQREPCSDFSPFRNVYFGDLHFHTSLSHDAWIFGVRSTPEDAYLFAEGEPLDLPAPGDEDPQGTRTLRLERPLDFAALSEHAEFLAETDACVTAGSEAYDSPACRIYRQGNFLSTIAISNPLFFPHPRRSPDICGPAGVDCPEVAERVWRRIGQAAEEAYDRTSACSFTTFPAYEYTATTLAVNLHRNVIFRNAHVPAAPISYFEQASPGGLRAELKRRCLEGPDGCDVIVVPHNANESNGNKFFVGDPAEDGVDGERQAAALRAEMEPLVEIFQNKGDSECMNGLSGVPGEPDALCDFEKLATPSNPDCGDGTGLGGVMGLGCVSRFDFVRNVLLAGLEEEERLGVNPYRLGVVASTDTHNASPGAVAEDAYEGHLGNLEDTPQKRLAPKAMGGNQGVLDNPGGLTAVWAVENSRDALFEALRRRETYATSGPRMVVRFFGGWGFPETLCEDPGFEEIGYDRGVPMGGDLPPGPPGAGAPVFTVLALAEQDLGGRKPAPLQRLQMIKGWIDREEGPMQEVFEIAGDPENGAGVDPDTCERKGQGFDRLCTVWRDPEFDPRERAFYYVRVVENPSCRWSTHECNRLDPEDRPAACSDPEIPKWIQERAWTSPIWYRPRGE